MSQLAIYGGTKTIKDGEVKPWPPVDETDENLVLDALYSTNSHVFRMWHDIIGNLAFPWSIEGWERMIVNPEPV